MNKSEVKPSRCRKKTYCHRINKSEDAGALSVSLPHFNLKAVCPPSDILNSGNAHYIEPR